jgi:hypothetical protein
MRNQIIRALLAIGACVAVVAPAAALPAKVVVDKEGPEEAVFAEIRKVLTSRIPAATLSATLTGFDAYIDRRVGQDGKRVTLYPAALAEFIRMAHGANWASEEVSAFMIYLQAEIDDEGRSPTLLLQHVAQEMQTGRTPEQIKAGLEKREGVTH